MEVITAKTAGFCFGVERAVNMVHKEMESSNGSPVYTCGPLIHNEEVIKELASKNVHSIESSEKFNNSEKGTVVLRAHGVTLDTFEQIEKAGHRIVDATCPFVLKIHNIAKKVTKEGGFLVIIGDSSHPEVKAIKSFAKNNSIVISTKEEAKDFVEKGLNHHKKLCIVSQTTFNFNKFQELVEIFPKNSYHINDVLNTICNATEERQREAALIASKVDAMIVIGGRNSSNTQKLYEICGRECKNTYYIQTAADMDFSQLRGMNKVGITAGASTPKNIIEEVQTRCQN